jgi:hypothetical protein
MNREPTYGIRGNISNPGIRFIKIGGEMKIRRKLRTTAGVLLVLMLASGAQAATVVLDEIDFMCGTETRKFFFEIIEGGHSRATLTDFEFHTPFDALTPGIFTANVLGVAGWDSDLSLFRLLDLSLSRLKESDEPMPVVAVLILVGLIGLIALKGRRK